MECRVLAIPDWRFVLPIVLITSLQAMWPSRAMPTLVALLCRLTGLIPMLGVSRSLQPFMHREALRNLHHQAQLRRENLAKQVALRTFDSFDAWSLRLLPLLPLRRSRPRPSSAPPKTLGRSPRVRDAGRRRAAKAAWETLLLRCRVALQACAEKLPWAALWRHRPKLWETGKRRSYALEGGKDTPQYWDEEAKDEESVRRLR